MLFSLLAPAVTLAYELGTSSTPASTPAADDLSWLPRTGAEITSYDYVQAIAALTSPTSEAPAAQTAVLDTTLLPDWYNAQSDIDTSYFVQSPTDPTELSTTLLPDWYQDPAAPLAIGTYAPAQCTNSNDLAMTLTVPPYDVSRGNVAGDVYTVTVQNTGTFSTTEMALRIDPNVGFYYLGGTAVATSSLLTTTVPITDPGTTTPDDPFLLQPTGTVTETSLLPGETMTFNFTLATTAAAQSGQMLRAFLQSGSPTAADCKSTEQNVQTVHGNLEIVKSPATQEGSVGETITWTVQLLNTGLGDVYDAVFTDTIGAGLTNMQISPAPTLLDLAPNATQDYTVTAVIASCTSLTNTVAASWSIGNNDGTGSTGTPVTDEVDVILALDEPDIAIEMGAIPDQNVCGALDVTIPITLTNNGGAARNLRLNAGAENVTLQNLDTTNWSGFTYTGGTPAGTMLPGEVITFNLRVTSPTICSTDAANVTLEPVYNDACLLWEDTSPAATAVSTLGADAPTLNVDKTGPGRVDAGDTISYTVTVNGDNQQSLNGDVVLTDTVPAFLDIQAITVSGGSIITNGNQIVWNVPTTGIGAYAETMQIDVSVPADGAGFCAAGDSFTNSVTAVATPCPECPPLTASDQVQTYVNDELGAANSFTKTITDAELCSTDPLQRVEAVMQINNGITWANTLYTDTLGQDIFLKPLTVVPGTTQVLVDGIDRTGDVTVTLGPPYTVDFSAIGTVSATANITISYNIMADAGTIVDDAPQQEAFLFSQFALGGSGSNSCTGGDVGQLGDWITLFRGDLDVTVSPDVIDSCRPEDVTLTVSGGDVADLTDGLVVTFTAQPTDIFTPTTAVYGGAFSGQTPTVDRSGSVVTFTFPAGFELDGSGTITFPLYRPCGTTGDLTAGLAYQDRCDVPRSAADLEGTTTHTPDVTLFTTPERYTVVSTEATWRFYASSNGTADAHDVTITNTLPIGHSYRDHTLTSTTLSGAQLSAITMISGTTPTGNQVLTFTIPTLPVGGRVQVDVTADVNTCDPLEELHVALFDDCNQTDGVCGGRQQDTVTFVKASTALNSSNNQSANLPLCEEGTIELVVKNSSPQSAEYDFSITDILTNATYITGSGRVTVTNATGDVVLAEDGTPLVNLPFTPTVATPIAGTQILTWTVDNYAVGSLPYQVLAERAAREEIHIFFDVRTGCAGVNASVQSFGSARDVCDLPLTFAEDSTSLVVTTPELAATKQVRNATENSTTGSEVFAGVGDTLVWQIDVVNNGQQRVTNLFVNDQLPPEFAVTAVSPITSSQSGSPPLLRWHEGGGQTLDANGGAISYEITTTVGANVCAVDTTNVASASYACGTDDVCLTIPVTATANVNTKPAFTIDAADADVDQCRGGAITLNFANNGARAQNVVVTYDLPTGLQYAGLDPATTPPPDVSPPLGATGTLTWEYNLINSEVTTNTIQFNVVNQTGVCATTGVNGGNLADIQYEDTCGQPFDDVTADANAVTVRASDISGAAQTPITRTVENGRTYTWTISIPNSGDGATNNMLVTETLGVGWTNISAGIGSPGGATPGINGNEITWDVGALPAGETWTAVFTATTVDASTDYRTTLAVQTSCSDGTCLQTTAVPNYNTPLQLFDKQIGQTPVSIGESFSYTITADFWGDRDYSSVLLTDTLPRLDNTLVFSVTGVTISNENSGTNTWQVGPRSGDTLTFTTSAPAPGVVDGPDFVTITVTGLISNAIAADNNDVFTNRVDLTYTEDGQNYAYARTRDGTIREPSLSIDKTAVSATNLDAGDDVTYTLTIDDLPAATATAYDLTVVDTLPDELTVKPGSISAPGAAFITGDAQTITVTYASFAVGDPARTISYVATLDSAVSPDDGYDNTAVLTYTSTPGDNPDERTGTGVLPDDHRDTDTATVNTATPTIAKTFVTTDLADTSDRSVAIGEIITYRVAVTLPEGTLVNAQLQDVLNGGLAFVGCDAITTSADVATSLGSFSTACSDPANPAITNNGRTATFDFGTITNSNSDNAVTETLTVTYRVVVLNTTGNNRGNTRNNTAAFSWNTGSVIDNAPNATIVEPTLLLDKSVTPATGDGGDVVTFTLTVQHAAGSNAPAFDLVLSDALPTGMTLVPGSWQHVSGIAATPTVSGDTLTATVPLLDVGETSTLEFAAQLGAGVQPDSTITNTAVLRWTSLPGDESTPRSPYDTDSVERTGDETGPNDYHTDDDAGVTTGPGGLDKQLIATNHADTTGLDVAVGEILTYQVVITVPESTLNTAVLTDTLPAGLAVVAVDDVTASPAIATSIGTFADVRDNANATLSNPGETVVLDFGTLVNSDNDNATTEAITITYRAVVLNTTGNNRGDTRQNQVDFTWATGSHSAGAPAVTIVEPTLTVDKTVTPATVDAGDTVTFTLIIAHDGSSDAHAYNVVISDEIPAGLTYEPGSWQQVSGVAAMLDDTAVPTLTAAVSTLMPGQQTVLRFRATVDNDVAPLQTITNTAVTTWTSLPGDVTTPQSPYNGTSTERTGSTTDPGGAANDYRSSDPAAITTGGSTVAKSLTATSAAHTAGSNVTIGEIVTYTIDVTLPEGIVPSLTVTDVLPMGLTYVPGTAVVDPAGSFGGTLTPGDPALSGGSGSGDDLIISFSTITVTADNNAANNVLSIQLQARVLDVPGNAGVGTQTTLDNSAQTQIGVTPPNGTPPVTITVVEPQLAITKTFLPDQAAAGESVTVQLQVENVGTSTAFDVEIADPLADTYFTNVTEGSTPAGFTFAADATPPTTTVRYSGGAIAAGDTVTATFSAELTTGVVNGMLITNTATVTQATTLPGPDPNEREAPDVSDDDTLTGLGPDLAVSKDDGETAVGPGQTLIYTIAVTNSGTFTATGVTLSDTIPANTHFVAADAGGSESGGVVNWSLGTVGPGNSVTRTLTVQVDQPLAPGVTAITNTTTVADDGTRGDDPTPDNNRDDDVDAIIHVDLELDKVVSDNAPNLGDTVVYTLTLTNRGPDIATNVTVSDTLPAGLTYDSSIATIGSYDDVANLWTVGTLPAGVTATLQIAVTVSSSGVYTNTAWVETADQVDLDSTPGNDVPSEDDQDDAGLDTRRVDVELVKLVSDAAPNLGTTVTYTLSLTNRGPDTATNIVVTDTLPTAGVSYAAHDASRGSFDSGTGVWTVPTLAQNETATLDLAVTVIATGRFTNTAEVTAVDQFDTDSTPDNHDPGEDDQDDVPIDVPDTADLGLDKAAQPQQPNVGDTVVFTLTVANAGPDTASGVVISDVLPAQLTFVNAAASQGSYDDATGLWNLGALTVPQTETLVITATVTANGVITNVAEIFFSDQYDPDSTPDNDNDGEDDRDTTTQTPPLRLGNRVWIDANDNGLLDAGETAVPGVELALLDGSGNPVLDPITGLPLTTTTDATGTYTFTHLLPGDYVVHVPAGNFDHFGDPLFGFVSSSPTFSADDTVDENDSGINHADPRMDGVRSGVVTLAPQTEPTSDAADEDGTYWDDNSNLTVDFGFFELLTLGNRVWFDTNNNGRYDGGESGVPAGVVLNLLDGSGNPVLHPITGLPITTTTDAAGYYLFTNLYPGDYVVQLAPDNFQPGGPLVNYLSSTGSTDPNDDLDEDDSGLDAAEPAITGITSNPVTLNYDTEPDNNDDTDDNDNTNLSVDFGLVMDPTAVTLTSFRAAAQGNRQVLLTWETAAEIDNFGFRLHRGETAVFGDVIQIYEVASAAAQGGGSSYSYLDTVPRSGRWYYWLEDVDTAGKTAVHGPISLPVSLFYYNFLPLIIAP